MRIRSVLKHTAQALIEGSLIALLVVGLMAGSVFAAKPTAGGGGGGKHGGGGSTSGSLALVLVTDTNANGSANWGDTITFTVTGGGTNPYVSVTCTQGGTLVYSASAGFYDSYPWPGARNMPLSSPAWTGGAASCNATLNGASALNFAAGA
jgi:hypothetical protein